MEGQRATSPVLPNNMRRDVRSPRLANLAEPPRASSLYAELTVDEDFWATVLRRYQAAIVEQRQPSALLRANIASHLAISESPEARVLREFADSSGTFVLLRNMSAAFTALGADCSDRVAASIVAQCAGAGSRGLTEAQFMMVAEGIRTAASQCVMAERLRCRTPDRDQTLRLSMSRMLSPQADDPDTEGVAGVGTSSQVGTPRGRSPSIGGRASSAAYRRPSSVRAPSVSSARSGAHTLKSLASLKYRLGRATADEQAVAVSSPRTPTSGLTPFRRAPSAGSNSAARSSATKSVFASPLSAAPRVGGDTETAYRRSQIPEPTLDGHKDLGPRMRAQRRGGRNAIATRQPVFQEDRFGVASFRW